jgi:Cu(I)/Ag(I) efflux system membrane fusion protein
MKQMLLIIVVSIALVVGVLIGRTTGHSPAESTEAVKDREILYWVAPMDANYRRDEPGKSPMGMDLVPVYADEVDSQPGVVKIDPVVVNNLGVRTEAAMLGTLPSRIETVGYIAYDEDTVQHVHTRVEGWVERLATKASGESVDKGQLLFELYSPTLVNAQEEFLTALRSGNKTLLRASRERLASLGVSESEIARLERERSIRQRVRVFADSDGVISHLGVREGAFVTPATEVMTVAKLDTVWVMAEVFERQAGLVAKGQKATIRLDYLPGETMRGMVDYVYPEVDPQSRTLTARIRLDNPSRILQPNMFTNVLIEADSQDRVVHVPRSAVIRGGAVDRVVLALGSGRFQAVPVELGRESGDRVVILTGVRKGDEVVTGGQFLIDSESNIGSALSKMGSEAMQ